MTFRTAFPRLAALLLAACAGLPRHEPDEQTLERFLQYSQPAVNEFAYYGRVDWRPLGSNHLVVWTNINDAYLLTVADPCQELAFATRIVITSTNNRVMRGFDAVRPASGQRCTITEIRPVDYRQMKLASRESRQRS